MLLRNYLLTSHRPDITNVLLFDGLYNLHIYTVMFALCGLLDEVCKDFPDATAVDIRETIRQKLLNAVKLQRVQRLKQSSV